MTLPSRLAEKLGLLQNTLYFFKKHFIPILGLGLIAAFGRVIQLGGFGEINTRVHVLLELVIESARILLCIYVLGLANIRKGALRIRFLLTQSGNRRQLFLNAMRKLQSNWFSVLINLSGFLVIAWTINQLIDLLAYQTCLFLTLKTGGILAASSSEWTILLFFKNLTVIPLTLIFDTLLVLWLSNKLTDFRKPNLA